MRRLWALLAERYRADQAEHQAWRAPGLHLHPPVPGTYMSWFIIDLAPPDQPGPVLYCAPDGNPYPTEAEAEAYANLLHPDDMSGDTVVLQAVKP